MELKQDSIENSLEEVMRIAALSFGKFHSREKIFERLKGKRYWLYLAEERGLSVGFKIWYEDSDGEVYSWLSAVVPEYRGKGIATKLMKTQFRICSALRYNKIKVKTHAGHPEMIGLLKKEGFQVVGREAGHWGDEREAIFFEKSLR